LHKQASLCFYISSCCAFSISAYIAPPHRVGHNALTAVVCLSVCLSVPCLNLRRERKGAAGWKLAVRNPYMGDPSSHLEVDKSKVKVIAIRYIFTHFLRRPDEWTVTRFGM